MESVTDKASTSSNRSQQNNQNKYTQEEIDAAYALLALSNSAPDPSAGNRAACPKLEAELYVTMDEPPMAPQNTSIEHHLKSVQHSMDNQVSPLTKLNSFVATTLPVREGHYVYSHYVSQPCDITMWRCETHGSWSCQQCFHAANP
ncbi:uncharacterized protein [Pocillopora verrucosa]|uniref:uncharacterized protein n=1 Tax=Pocillopora verrucosa TaxID=203993 RepID=UPI003341746D